MSRKVLSVLLATAMTASLLVGCGGAAAPAADAAAPAATEEAAPAEDAAPAADAAEEAPASDVGAGMKVGVAMPTKVESHAESITIESFALSITTESLALSITQDSLSLFITQEENRQLTTRTAPQILMFTLFIFIIIVGGSYEGGKSESSDL